MADSQGPQPRKGWSTFAIEQKVGVIIFAITGFGGLILSIIFIGQSLRAPFQVNYDGEAFATTSQREAEEVERQKRTDTDGDGINDYDELNVYRTSPYLADSDSDGFDDGQEIKSGNDPNCPTDEEGCGRAVDSGVNSPLVASDLTDQLPFEDAGLGVQIQDEGDIQTLLSQLSTDEIRAALLQQGIDQATVDSLSDQELRDLFDSALDELADSGAITEILEQTQ